MKIALLLLPERNDTVDRIAYTRECTQRIQEEGFVLLQPAEKVNREFIESVAPLVDTFFLYTDFGTSFLMSKVAKHFPEKTIEKQIGEPDIQTFLVNTLDSILKYAASKQGVQAEALKGKCRKRHLVETRMYYFKRSREVTRFSLVEIAAFVNRDHATVLHGIKTVDNVAELTQRYNELFHGAPHIERKAKMVVKKKTEQKPGNETPVLPEYKRPPAVYSNQRQPSSMMAGAYHGYREHF